MSHNSNTTTILSKVKSFFSSSIEDELQSDEFYDAQDDFSPASVYYTPSSDSDSPSAHSETDSHDDVFYDASTGDDDENAYMIEIIDSSVVGSKRKSREDEDIFEASSPIKRQKFLFPEDELDLLTLMIMAEKLINNFGSPEVTNVVDNQEFISQLVIESDASKETLQLAIIYFNRLQQVNVKVIDCKRRMFLGALILAHKYLNDCTWKMKSWSIISNLPTREIIDIQDAVLEMLNYKLYTSPEDFEDKGLEKLALLKEGKL